MSRELKFRAWDIDAAEMFYTGDDNGMYFGFVSNLEFGASNLALFLPVEDDFPEKREAVIMQYTGFKDKNGDDIYEGDVMFEHRSGMSADMLGVVKFDTDMGAFVVEKSNGGFDIIYIFLSENKKAYSEGNIYQNPELL